MKLKDYTILEYSKLHNVFELDNLLKNLKSNNVFCNKEINIQQLPYSTIKYVQKIFRKDNLTFNDIAEIFISLFDISKEDFYNTKISEFYPANKYIKSKFELIAKNENILFESSNLDIGKWKASGGDRLNSFDLIGLHSIAERYGLYIFELANKPYSEIFYIQSMLKIYDEVNFNYNKQE